MFLKNFAKLFLACLCTNSSGKHHCIGPPEALGTNVFIYKKKSVVQDSSLEKKRVLSLFG